MKVAIVHDQLREFGGAERVLISLKEIFPDAPVYTSTYDNESLGIHKDLIKKWQIHTSWFGKIPIINRYYSPFRFLTPWIWESFDFSSYDLVISSSGSWMCKGIKTKHPTIHIAYIHHPPRYLYGYETAIEWQKYFLIKIYGNIVNHFLRMWDYTSSQRADYFIANSEETKKRIQKFYRRDATVIYPSVNIPSKISNIQYSISKQISNHQSLISNHYYITVCRLARAKHVDILIKAAKKMSFNLKMVGSGKDMKYLKSIAGKTVEFVGNINDQELKKLYQHSKAFLFSSVDEEFGIAPVEAMGYGVPVIAYKSGGLTETIRNGYNGYLFDELNPDSLIQKVNEFESLSVKKLFEMKKHARKIAEEFSEENFKKRLLEFIRTVLHR